MLYLPITRCGRLATTSTIPSWAAYVREAPSAPNRIPPLAIYVRRYTFFFFWRRFSIYSFLFLLISSIALNITISHPLIS
jgi:hypothetical protein